MEGTEWRPGRRVAHDRLDGTYELNLCSRQFARRSQGQGQGQGDEGDHTRYQGQTDYLTTIPVGLSLMPPLRRIILAPAKCKRW
jgi:hypothetical protein